MTVPTVERGLPLVDFCSIEIAGLNPSIKSTSGFSRKFDNLKKLLDTMQVGFVFLTASVEVRIARVHRREYEIFGDRVLKGGDMFESHQRFLDDVASYDYSGGSTSLTLHTKWAESLPCQVLRLDGSNDLSNNLQIIVDNYKTLHT